MTVHVFPSVNNVGGDGKPMIESILAAWAEVMALYYYVRSGLTQSSSGLVLTISSGIAYIAGYRVNADAPMTITLPASSTSYVFLQLTRDGLGNVTGAQLIAQAGSVLTDSVLLYQAVTSGSAVTSTTDMRVVTPWGSGAPGSGPSDLPSYGTGGSTGSGLAAARYDHTHGVPPAAVPTSQTFSASLSADVSLSASTITNLLTLSLTTGTWQISGQTELEAGAQSGCAVEVTDGTNTFAAEGVVLSGGQETIAVTSVMFTVSGSATITLAAFSVLATTALKDGTILAYPTTFLRATRMS